jgi:short-subunit dehydrogenase
MELQARYGSWALVAGASEGLGASIAREAAGRGFNLVTIARRKALLEDQANGLRADYDVEVRPLAVDLAAPDLWEQVAMATEDLELGVFIYNAAYVSRGRFLDVELRQHLAGIDVNCRGPAILSYQLGKKMVERGRGAIVLVTSMGALQGSKVFASYGAGKAYEWILAEGLWDELRERGVDVLSYVVGVTASPSYLSTQPATVAHPPKSLGSDDPGEALANRIRFPMSPEGVARRLFDVIDQGPRQFSNPIDERAADKMAGMPRKESVLVAGRVTTGGWD